MSSAVEYLQGVDAVIAEGPFADTWDSFRAYSPPNWYVDGKFGIFVHWGVFSVPAFRSNDEVDAPDSTWYPRRMYQEGTAEYAHHRETYGPQSRFGYKDFIPQFTAEDFDPDAWAALFRRAGAQFVVPVAEHHDGFALYDCQFSDWTAVRMGPKRDIVGELAAAVRRQSMVLGLSSHRAEHWWFMNGGTRFDSDVRVPAYAELYGPAQPEHLPPNEAFLEDWLARTCELVDKYEPQLMYFDWWIEEPAFEPYLRRFAAYYYNHAAANRRGVAINHKKNAFPEGAAVFDIERGQCSDIREPFWQTDTSMSKNAWSYVPDHDYKALPELIGDLVDIVSKNGALLLNVGPMANGVIPEAEQNLLLGIGDWLGVNGEAVYGTRPWRAYGEGPTKVSEGKYAEAERDSYTSADIRFTMRGDVLYAVALAWPDDGHILVRSLGTGSELHPVQIADVDLLGHSEPLRWERLPEGLLVSLPETRPTEHAPALRVIPAGTGRPRWH